jgi:hypothetical protein
LLLRWSSVELLSCCLRAQCRTDIVSIKWRLAFEFVLGVETPAESSADGGVGGSADSVASAPAQVEVEKLHWTLPIVVLSAYPSNIPSHNSPAGLKF